MLKKTNQKQSAKDEVGKSLGLKLRRSRKEAKLTMQQVADAAGLSVGFISQVERNITVPSLSSLRAISKALGKSISFFLEQPSGSESSTRAHERVNFQVAAGALSYERLSAQFPGSTLRSVIVHEPPGHRNEPISHEGEELFFMLKGVLTVEVEGARTVLREGDSLHFDSSKVHSTWNHGTETASLLWCGTMDVFGDDTIDPIHKNDNANKKN
jgi:transcriptional regulator with XRE-family HTH domain